MSHEIKYEDFVSHYTNESIAYLKKVMSGEVKLSTEDKIKQRESLIDLIEIEKDIQPTSFSQLKAMSKLQDICRGQINYLSGNVDMSISPKSPTIEEVLSQSFDPCSNF